MIPYSFQTPLNNETAGKGFTGRIPFEYGRLRSCEVLNLSEYTYGSFDIVVDCNLPENYYCEFNYN